MSDPLVYNSIDDFISEGIKAFVPAPILEQQQMMDNILNNNEDQ